MKHACGALTGSGLCLTQHPSSRSCLGRACSADAGDTGNLLDREMRPPEPQQTRIAFGAWQGFEQCRIYARQNFARNGKGLLIGDPPAWKNLH